MTHTAKELLTAWENDKPVWNNHTGRRISDYKIVSYYKDTEAKNRNTILTAFIKDPTEFTLTDPNKPTPKVGDELTLEQLPDVEFMRQVKRVRINQMHREFGELLQGDGWYNRKIQDMAWAINNDLAVTIAEVTNAVSNVDEVLKI